MNIATLLSKNAWLFRRRNAIVSPAQSWNYQEFADRVSRLAAGLRELGLQNGDRVALYLDNSSEFLESLFATFWAGLVAVPINTRLHPKEMFHILQDSGARVLIFDHHEGFSIRTLHSEVPSVEHCFKVGEGQENVPAYSMLRQGFSSMPAAEVDAEQAAWLFYTSGTTGKSKGAILSHRNLLAATMSFFADIGPLEPDDTFIHIGPLTHGSGLYCFPSLARGCCNAILPLGRFNPESVFQGVEKYRATHTFVVPTVLKRLTDYALESGKYPASLKTLIYGGSPIHLEDLRRSIRVFGTRLVQIYGQGESPMTISYLPACDHVWCRDPRQQKKLTSAGIPRTDVEV